MKFLVMALALLPWTQLRGVGSNTSTQPAAQTTEEANPKPTGATVSVHRGSLSSSVEAQGYFEPVDPFEVRIRPKAYGGDLKIVSIVANGKAVKKGDVLLSLDTEAIDKQIAAAENENKAAHANLVRAQADAKLSQAGDALALKVQTETTQRIDDEVKWFEKVDGPNILLEAAEGVKNIKANVEDQQDELDQLKKMYKTDDLTTDTADIVVKRAVRNLENLKIAEKIQEESADKTVKVTYEARKLQVQESAQQADEQLEGLKIAQEQGRVFRETGLATTTAAADAADEQLAHLKADKQKLEVTAPMDGIVLYGQLVGGAFQGGDEHALREGEHVAAGQVLMTLYQPGKLRLHLDLPEAKFFAIHPGDKAIASPVAYSEEKIEATCDKSPAAPIATQQGPQYNLTATCRKVDGRLSPGMRANVKVDVRDSDVAILAPKSAVADGYVWVKTDDGMEKRHVTIGKSDENHVLIQNGLSDGEQIFVEAQK